MESRGEVRGSKRREGWREEWRERVEGGEYSERILREPISRTMEYERFTLRKFVFFSYPRFQSFFFLFLLFVICFELAFRKDWNQFALLWKESRSFFFFLSFRNKRKKGRNKVYLGDERKEDSFFLIGGGEGFSSANKTDLEKELEGINLLT